MKRTRQRPRDGCPASVLAEPVFNSSEREDRAHHDLSVISERPLWLLVENVLWAGGGGSRENDDYHDPVCRHDGWDQAGGHGRGGRSGCGLETFRRQSDRMC